MCRFLKISRAAYYAWKKQLVKPDKDQEYIGLVNKAYEASKGTYGYRRVQIWISQKCGVVINHKAVLRLMNKLGIHSIARRRKFYTKFEKMEALHHFPNLLNREFSADKPNQKWVTDVTYINTKQGRAFLSTIKDLHDGFIVAYHLGKNNSVENILNTLRLAKRKAVVTDGLILHSDQGLQYSSFAYYSLTKKYNISPSMSRSGNCWDNAVIENFFGHLKEEAIRHFPNPSFEEAKQIIDDYIQFYNYERIQLKTRQTPYQLRCLSN
jgi:transposase InsO family protein